MKTATDTAKRAPILLMRPFSSHDDYNADCDIAIVELTPELVEKIRKRAKIVQAMRKQDRDVYEVYFWCGCEPSYFSWSGPGEHTEEREWDSDTFDSRNWDVAPEWLSPTAYEDFRERTECEQMIIRISSHGNKPDGVEIEVAWTATPKHSSIQITTPGLSMEDLDSIIAGKA